jgi:isoquinoline 1-oxidoreductase beta subunit
MSDMPVVEVAIIESGAPLGGIGEAGTPPIAPAVVNALAKLTGSRIRSLPLSTHHLVTI